MSAASRVLAGALGWLETNLEWFAPERWEEHLPRRPFPPSTLLELLGLVRLLSRSGVHAEANAAFTRRAVELAARTAAAPSFGEGLRRGDELFPYHLNLVSLLDLLGRPQPTSRTRCQALLDADAGGHTQPHKPVLNRLELRYFLDRGGFAAPSRLPDAESLYAQSIAALSPDVHQLTSSETYALTHSVFYATDFGQRPCPDTPGSEALREAVRVLLGVHLARRNLDLLSELLLCARALGGPTLTFERQGWEAVEAAQRSDGAVPSPVHRPEVLEGLTGDKAAAYLFGTCYHTTLAAALAATVTLRSVSPGPDLGVPMPRADRTEVLAWANEVRKSPSAHDAWREQLDPLLVIAVQDADPMLLDEILHAAEHLGMQTAPLPRSATALRLAVDWDCPAP
ncbi:DUF6895 family protein [Streptomyces sp. NRRL F-2580]|uniref:DUF6895 family protein n=1 Tax=Streptomyces sp. NRRL F-2580 TaxID=1463841 RepID=UPI00068B1CD1|nr:hypothetical protein [Streptomyces sp. NRRL F-2580]